VGVDVSAKEREGERSKRKEERRRQEQRAERLEQTGRDGERRGE